MTTILHSLKNPARLPRFVDGIQVASIAVTDAIEIGRQPDMPLGVLAKAVREAPMAALWIASLIGYVVAKPQRKYQTASDRQQHDPISFRAN